MEAAPLWLQRSRREDEVELVSRRHERHFILVELRNYLCFYFKLHRMTVRLCMTIRLSAAIASCMPICRNMRLCLLVLELLSLCRSFERAGGSLSSRDYGR